MIPRRKPKNLTIRLSDIGQTGLSISEELLLDDLNERMNASPGNDIQFTATPQIILKITALPEGAEVSGEVSTKYNQPCGRCLDRLPRDLSVKFRYQLKPHQKEHADDELDDRGLIFYTGEHVDLTEHIQESLILALSPYLLPNLDQNKKCLECSRQYLNEASKVEKANLLGAALSQIKIKASK